MDLLARMRAYQQGLVDLANGAGPPAEAGTDVRLKDFLAGLKDAWKVGILRPTPKPTRTYRTRADPFEASAADLERIFESAMGKTSRDLFKQLCAWNPDVYTEQQLRTFQRRQKKWRAERADAMILGHAPVASLG